MNIPPFTLEKLRSLPIFDVCAHLGITLHGTGQYTRRAICWNHDDKHPSMHINQKLNIFKCFACGNGGDVISLVMSHENLSFVEACEWLAREFSIVISDGRSKTFPRLQSRPATRATEKPDDGKCRSVPVVSLDVHLVSQTLSVKSEFCQALVSSGYLTEQQMRHAAQRYQLGISRNGSVVFWEIDTEHRVRNGKLMHYLPDCHRDKSRPPTWVAAELKKAGKLSPDINNPHCLFGLHLLGHTDYTGHTETTELRSMAARESQNTETKKIAIVESEKSAVILSEKFPDFVWLSCGGLQMFKPHLLEPLTPHRIIIFPDTDEKGETFRQWNETALEAQRLYEFRYPLRVSPLLEQNATKDQKQRKIDLVDYLFQ